MWVFIKWLGAVQSCILIFEKYKRKNIFGVTKINLSKYGNLAVCMKFSYPKSNLNAPVIDPVLSQIGQVFYNCSEHLYNMLSQSIFQNLYELSRFYNDPPSNMC